MALVVPIVVYLVTGTDASACNRACPVDCPFLPNLNANTISHIVRFCGFLLMDVGFSQLLDRLDGDHASWSRRATPKGRFSMI
mmetsp:Transcript_69383/g.137595  ORF Transcript_69383/g.137595 Transcript_69383/m.137595 type:complete len:83 (-) Transcript_69383:129-377(-)